jgi:hypothetical protein
LRGQRRRMVRVKVELYGIAYAHGHLPFLLKSIG